MLNTVYAPGSATTSESFLWYSVNPRLTLGVAYLQKQGAFRVLGSYLLSPETETMPSTHISAGVQGIGTGNPGYSATAEKNWDLTRGTFNAYIGVGYRTNKKSTKMVGGMKYSPDAHWSIGLQNDGIVNDPFLTYSEERFTTGIYLIDMKNPAYMVGFRF
ncbi:MAG: hypothetical protein QOJ65_1883 [Fimbriimonadaceae bacterium]|jgi:hypothetical protein|nr:hypothetical protein [Fimbriimonadaceae bacterium]